MYDLETIVQEWAEIRKRYEPGDGQLWNNVNEHLHDFLERFNLDGDIDRGEHHDAYHACRNAYGFGW